MHLDCEMRKKETGERIGFEIRTQTNKNNLCDDNRNHHQHQVNEFSKKKKLSECCQSVWNPYIIARYSIIAIDIIESNETNEIPFTFIDTYPTISLVCFRSDVSFDSFVPASTSSRANELMKNIDM
ncbi:meiosis arrest female protein 1 [Sarcoptes scabiei]|nr:meiosis arrest female protein 1 [Sarcoptes scabiei]